MTAAGVNAAEPRPLPVVACGLPRHGNANDLHVSMIVAKRETLSFPIPFTREAAPSATEQRERCFDTPAASWAHRVRAGRRCRQTPSHSRQDDRRRTEAHGGNAPPYWAAAPSPRTERKLLIK